MNKINKYCFTYRFICVCLLYVCVFVLGFRFLLVFHWRVGKLKYVLFHLSISMCFNFQFSSFVLISLSFLVLHIILLHCDLTTRLYYFIIIRYYYTTLFLLYCSITALLYYYIITILLYYYITIIVCAYIIMLPCCHLTILSYCYILLWLYYYIAIWFYD